MSKRRPERNEQLPWWSRPLRIAIRVIAIAVLAVFIVLTVIRLLP